MVNRIIRIVDATAAGKCTVYLEFAHEETGGSRYNKCLVFATDETTTCTAKAFDYIKRRENLYGAFMYQHMVCMNQPIASFASTRAQWMRWLDKSDSFVADFGGSSIDLPTRWLINLVERNVDRRLATHQFGVDVGGSGTFEAPADRDWSSTSTEQTHLEFKFVPYLLVNPEDRRQVPVLKALLGEVGRPCEQREFDRVVRNIPMDARVTEDRHLTVYKVVEVSDLTNDNDAADAGA